MINMYRDVTIKYCTLQDYKKVIDSIPRDTIVMQLCDGTEIDGYPGLSVVKYLEETGMKFTGACSDFFEATTSKRTMKRLFVDNKVNTAPYTNKLSAHTEDIGYPIIVKPDVSYASIGITMDSVIHTSEELDMRIQSLTKDDDPIFERYIDGREFTVLVTDSKTYTPAERVFIGDTKFLAFDMYWKTDDLTISKNNKLEYKNNLNTDDFVVYRLVLDEPVLCRQLMDIARRAYNACYGNSYGRVDIRQDCQGSLYVLEVNSMPSVSIDKETSLGNILTLVGGGAECVYREFINDVISSATASC